MDEPQEVTFHGEPYVYPWFPPSDTCRQAAVDCASHQYFRRFSGDFPAIFAIFSVVTFQLRGTPTQVTTILVAFLTPLAVISPIAGVFVDKWKLKATLLASDVIRGLLALVLVFVRDLDAI